MKSNPYCECNKVDNYHELFDMIKGKDNNFDIREKCIFRGLEKDTYHLEPYSMRNNCEELNKFISNSEMLSLPIKFNNSENIKLRLDKEFKNPNDGSELSKNLHLVQKWKEFNVLMKFINTADKNGLKINVDERIRRLIDLKDYEIFFKHWPDQILWENIALAQHYGTPTRFLDWSYDYKVAIYFAVMDIITEKNDDDSNGILWAFNYKLFNTVSHMESKEQFKLQFYRPEYSSNPNLNAQKGIFAFFVNKIYEDSFGEFHKIIIDQFRENDKLDKNKYDGIVFNRVHGLKTSDIPTDEKVFYKFIIPHELKKDILNELFKENYFTDRIFPGYRGVSESIRNKVILDKL